MIAVSKCLAGCNCTYSGKNNLCLEIKQLVEEGKAIMICPEVLGGLPTPRTPCEVIGDKVIDKNGQDKTREYQLGAQKALELCKQHGVKLAILKARSPSCGRNFRYDGTFSHTLVKGDGITTQLLLSHGIKVYNEDNLEEALEEIKNGTYFNDATNI